MIKRHISLCSVLIILLCLAVSPVSADTYDNSTSEITWDNSYVGTRTTTDNFAAVSVTYGAGGSFSITVDMTGNVGGVGDYAWTGTGSGTITGGVATATIDWSGTLQTVAGTQTCTNNGGTYSGSATYSGGTRFANGDVLALQAFNAGTVSPGVPPGSNTNWNHLTTGSGCSITFQNRIGLYSFDDFQSFGAGSIGGTRSQHFSPTEATPNSLAGSDTFDTAGFGIRLNGAGERLIGTLTLYDWNTDYATTIGQSPLGSTAFDQTAPFDNHVQVTGFAGLASSQYLLVFSVTDYQNPDTGWELRRSNSDDGGTNNDAFNNGPPARTDREYQVYLSGGTLPVDAWELY